MATTLLWVGKEARHPRANTARVRGVEGSKTSGTPVCNQISIGGVGGSEKVACHMEGKTGEAQKCLG